MHSKNVAEPFRRILNEFAPHVPPTEKDTPVKYIMVDSALLLAAVEFLRSGPALHQVDVNGKMMEKGEVAAALRLKADPPPHGFYRDMLDESEPQT